MRMLDSDGRPDARADGDHQPNPRVLALAEAKRRKVHDDPELFATHHAVAEQARDVVTEHLATLCVKLASIVRDGMTNGEFAAADAEAAAVFDATIHFHHPQHVRENAGRSVAMEADRVLTMLLAGLRSGAEPQVEPRRLHPIATSAY